MPTTFESLTPEQREAARTRIASRMPSFAKTAKRDILNQFDRAGDRVDINRLKEGLLTEGGETRREGIEAIRSFNPEDFLGADALSSLFDEATRTSFAPALNALMSRNARRGIRGPLAGALEGDLASSFHRTLMARVAENRVNAANMTLGRGTALATEGGFDRAQGLSLFGSQIEMNQAEAQRIAEERARKNALLGGLIGLTGRAAFGGTTMSSQAG